MAYETKDNTGSLFINKRKEQDNHPDRQGSIMVEGKEYWINGWLKKTQAGEAWLSLAVKLKTAPSKAPAGDKKPNKKEPEFDDGGDIPF